MTSNLVQRHVVWSCRLYQNLEQIDHNLHRQDFDDVICKPTIARTYRNLKIRHRADKIFPKRDLERTGTSKNGT